MPDGVTKLAESLQQGIEGTWKDFRNCTLEDAHLFFATKQDTNKRKREKAKKAKAICATCVVIKECLEYALVFNETEGVWGGLTSGERKKLRRKRRETQEPAS